MSPKPIREILRGPFAEWLGKDDWRPWSAFLCGLLGEPLTHYETAIYRRCTGRQKLPDKPFREAWVAVGRKGRKSATAAMLAVYAAVYGQWKRAAGETLRVMVIALSKDQARLVLDYAAAILESRPGLARLVMAKDAETIRLRNGVEIACFANSYRLVRGPTCVCAILDEVAVWWSDQLSANPDREILRALKPAMITQPGSLLIGLSSPYAKKGLLYEKYRDHFGRDDSKVLIWRGETATMNPQVDREEIEAAYLDDPISAAAEFGAQFRDDLQTYIVPEAIEACVERGIYERSPVPGVTYFSFIDPAGGSGQDAMTLAICHNEGDIVVLDCLRERKPPFNPSDVAAEFIETLKSYRVNVVHGDRFAGEWCRQPFRDQDIFYKLADRAKSDLYRDALPIFNSRNVSLLDDRALIGQLCNLERSTEPDAIKLIIREGRTTIYAMLLVARSAWQRRSGVASSNQSDLAFRCSSKMVSSITAMVLPGHQDLIAVQQQKTNDCTVRCETGTYLYGDSAAYQPSFRRSRICANGG